MERIRSGRVSDYCVFTLVVVAQNEFDEFCEIARQLEEKKKK